MIIFLLIAVSIWAGAHYYIGSRLISHAGLAGGYVTLGWAAVVALLFLGPSAFWTHEMEGWEAWKVAVAWAGYTAAGFSALLFGLTLLRDIGWASALAFNWLDSLAWGSEFLPPGAMRRTIFNWTSVSVVGLACLMSIYGIVMTRLGPRIERVEVEIPGLPAALQGLRIVEICDLHLSRTTPPKFMAELAADIRELAPDLLVFTGDFGEGKVSTNREAALELKDVKARYGKFFVAGNHEYYSDFPLWIRVAGEAGFTVLLNQARTLDIKGQPVYIAGITDQDARRAGPIEGHDSNLEAASAGLRKSDFGILLAHQPRRLDEAAKQGFKLMLSGHTHGGQIFPYTYVVRLFFRHSRGLNDVGGMKLFVSRGTGYWGPPIRVGSRAEITLLVLR